MPKFEKLSQEEIERLRSRRSSNQDLGEYVSYLDTLQPGDWGAVSLEDGETQRVIKRRLTVAGKRQGKEVKYKKGQEGRIVFEVREA